MKEAFLMIAFQIFNAWKIILFGNHI